MKRYIVLFIAFILTVSAWSAQDSVNVAFLSDEFNDLVNWKPLYFKKIENHTDYTIDKDGSNSYLRAESNASASGIILRSEFNVFEFPRLKWRWKISNVLKKGNARHKSGDDYPLRVYIVFKYNPDTAPFGKKIRYGLVKQLYGEYPPHSSLNYIWANRQHDESIITNTYAAEAKMIVLQEGDDNAGKWIEQDVNILDDYHKAFLEDPPPIAGIAIMSDSDNTGERAVAYIDYIEIYR